MELREKIQIGWVFLYFFGAAFLVNYLTVKYVSILLIPLFVVGFLRLLIFLFNCLLSRAIKKRITVKNLDGKDSPIYKIVKAKDECFYVWKYEKSIESLELDWEIPFGFLFQKEVFIEVGYYLVDKDLVIESLSIEGYWENCFQAENARKNKKKTKQQKEQEVLDKLNEKFNRNYGK